MRSWEWNGRQPAIGIPTLSSEWEEPTKWTRELQESGSEYEKLLADDPLRRAAEATVHNPLSTTTINISFAIRRAIRRYLGIEQMRGELRNVNTG